MLPQQSSLEVPSVIPPATFLAGMRKAASSVCIVTTDGAAGRAGITVNSMTSVSVDRPAVLVCIRKDSRLASAIRENKVFCVNLLQDHHTAVSDVFAGRGLPDTDRFASAEWTTLKTGSPALIGAATSFDCSLAEASCFGTHFLFIGDVVDVNTTPDTSTLVYHDRKYCTLSATPRLP
jgi:flavin reductase